MGRSDTGKIIYEPPGQAEMFRRLANLDIDGKHLWVMTGCWYISNPKDAKNPDIPKYMDGENLVVFTGPMCFKCEEPYSPRMQRQTCWGRIDS